MRPWMVTVLVALVLLTIVAVIYFKMQERQKELEAQIAEASRPQVTDTRTNVWDVIGGLLNI